MTTSTFPIPVVTLALRKISSTLKRLRKPLYSMSLVGMFTFGDTPIVYRFLDVPGPVNISESSIKIGNRSIEFHWFPPSYDGKKPIIEYRVQYSTGNESWNQTTTKTEIFLRSLRPHHLYKIGVQAVNTVGSSASINTIRVRTLQAGKKCQIHPFQTDFLFFINSAPGGPVRDLLAIAISSTSFHIKWSPPDPLLVNGNITNYHLCLIDTDFDKTNIKNVEPEKLNWPAVRESIMKLKNQLM